MQQGGLNEDPTKESEARLEAHCKDRREACQRLLAQRDKAFETDIRSIRDQFRDAIKQIRGLFEEYHTEQLTKEQVDQIIAEYLTTKGGEDIIHGIILEALTGKEGRKTVGEIVIETLKLSVSFAVIGSLFVWLVSAGVTWAALQSRITAVETKADGCVKDVGEIRGRMNQHLDNVKAGH